MKKLLIFLMALTVLLTLAACGTDDPTPTEHKHSYSSEVTAAATCEKEGVKTFTCACGDSYTERISATGHNWDEWLEDEAPTYTAKGKEIRGCRNCNTNETREVAQLDVENLFKNYPDVLHTLGWFSSVDDLTALRMFDWAINHIETVGETKDMENFIFSYTYSVEDLDKKTVSYFDKAWDYSTIATSEPSNGIGYAYSDVDKTVTVIYYGAFGDAGPEVKYESYKALDDTHFEITYSKAYWGEEPFKVIIKVELQGDTFVVTAQEKA